MSQSEESSNKSEDYDYYEPEDFQAERAVRDRVGEEVNDPKTFEGAVRIAAGNLDSYGIPVNIEIAKKVITFAQMYIPNYEIKNPTACILSYMCVKDGEIVEKNFNEMVKIINKNKDLNIKIEDFIRYCRMWLIYIKK